ncbi:MAG TPA: hypothetical protein VLG27_03975 [Candidatus Saccharimonadia bacterium]|nr:hypothetical protein [Candidatus Saccharimonadia bacterium]
MAAANGPATHNSERALQLAAWSLSTAVLVVAFVAWGSYYNWHLGHLSVYQIFPLLGLLAFSLMWSHYVAGAWRELAGIDKQVLHRYFELTAWAVLVLICLHPGLLIYQRFRDGFGLPPGSYESYVAPGLGWVTLLGTASLLVFLAFELRRVYGKRSWWHYVADASDLAMLAIFYHALRLGTQLHGWFRTVWWFYGLVLIAILIRKYWIRFDSGHKKSPAV